MNDSQQSGQFKQALAEGESMTEEVMNESYFHNARNSNKSGSQLTVIKNQSQNKIKENFHLESNFSPPHQTEPSLLDQNIYKRTSQDRLSKVQERINQHHLRLQQQESMINQQMANFYNNMTLPREKENNPNPNPCQQHDLMSIQQNSFVNSLPFVENHTKTNTQLTAKFNEGFCENTLQSSFHPSESQKIEMRSTQIFSPESKAGSI